MSDIDYDIDAVIATLHKILEADNGLGWEINQEVRFAKMNMHAVKRMIEQLVKDKEWWKTAAYKHLEEGR